MEAERRANVLRQIEFYLSDQALPYDDFFKKAYDEGGNAIPLELLAESPRASAGLDPAASGLPPCLLALASTAPLLTQTSLNRHRPSQVL